MEDDMNKTEIFGKRAYGNGYKIPEIFSLHYLIA
jgi:hypothetical protein